MNTTTTLTKKALRRDMSIPAWHPAAMHINCCGLDIPVVKPFDSSHQVECTKCGTRFNGEGYVLLNTVDAQDLAKSSHLEEMMCMCGHVEIRHQTTGCFAPYCSCLQYIRRINL